MPLLLDGVAIALVVGSLLEKVPFAHSALNCKRNNRRVVVHLRSE